MDADLADAIAECVVECLAHFDAQAATETDPDTRAALRMARPAIAALVAERCAIGMRMAWERHCATLH
jgi:hypothetical protein